MPLFRRTRQPQVALSRLLPLSVFSGMRLGPTGRVRDLPCWPSRSACDTNRPAVRRMHSNCMSFAAYVVGDRTSPTGHAIFMSLPPAVFMRTGELQQRDMIHLVITTYNRANRIAESEGSAWKGVIGLAQRINIRSDWPEAETVVRIRKMSIKREVFLDGTQHDPERHEPICVKEANRSAISSSLPRSPPLSLFLTASTFGFEETSGEPAAACLGISLGAPALHMRDRFHPRRIEAT